MNQLRHRVTLALLLAALVPSVLIGGFTIYRAYSQTRSDHRDRVREALYAAESALDRRDKALRHSATHLCEGEYVIDQLLAEIEDGALPAPARARMDALVPRLMRHEGLDTLDIFRSSGPPALAGELLVSGTGRQAAPEADALLRLAAMEAGEALFIAQTRGEGEQVEHLVVASCEASKGPATIRVVAGHVLSQARLIELIGDHSETRFELANEDGRVYEGRPRADNTRIMKRLHDASGNVSATVVVTNDATQLKARLKRFALTVAICTALALVLAFLLALWVRRQIVKPLRELEEAARRVGRGDAAATKTTSRDEVGRALSAFDRMSEDLSVTRRRMIRAERIAAWRDIARRIAHEIKNPLSPIQVSIETMRKAKRKEHPDFDEIFDESTVMILEEVGRMKTIVTEFSEFARMPRPKLTTLSPKELLDHVVTMHQGTEVNVELVAQETTTIEGDRDQLTQVLVNLVKNGMEAARARHGTVGGHVRVELKPDGDGISIYIEDNGPGIPEEQKAAIFEPYFTTKVGGTGLGLAIVDRIISDHGGTIVVSDAHGGGAVFDIHLPDKGPPQELHDSQSSMPLSSRWN